MLQLISRECAARAERGSDYDYDDDYDYAVPPGPETCYAFVAHITACINCKDAR